jgi:hypothetical protein
MSIALVFRRVVLQLLAAATCFVFLAANTVDTHAQQKGNEERIRGAFPLLKLKLPRKQAGGQEAIDQLGPSLAAIAAWYGKSERHLRAELLSDRRLRIDQTGRLMVIDELDVPLSSTSTAEAATGLQDGQLAPLDQTFKLHSKPGSQRTLYLDFDGATLSGTAWNTSGNTISAAPFDMDGNLSSFSTAELQRIQYIWQRVAEDYAPFDINVTTEAVPPDRISRSSTADQIFGTVALITRRSGVYSCSCGGVAYVGIFGMTTDFYKPALVFYDSLGPANEKFVAEAISHEVGHNLGLTHDGTASSGYYTGHGSDPATSWAPIMGVGYYKSLVQFSRGEYASANNRQDDFAVAQSYGLPLRSDDHGNSITTATTLEATASGGIAFSSANGVIETASNRDMFSFTAGRGKLTATVVTSARSPNADLVLSLYDAAGTLLASANPAQTLSAALNFQLPAQGTYYLAVSATGNGDPLGTGYSSYGSVGLYQLSTSYPTVGGSIPDAVLTASTGNGIAPLAVTLDASQSRDDKGILFYYWDFGDGTSDSTGSSRTVQKTYRQPGEYTARLTVVDDTGLSSTTAQTISVNAATSEQTAMVRDIRMSTKPANNSIRANAVIKVVNQSGSVLRGAAVRVTWNGSVTGTSISRTNKWGEVMFRSPPGSRNGCLGITVTSIKLRGHSFNASTLPHAETCN